MNFDIFSSEMLIWDFLLLWLSKCFFCFVQPVQQCRLHLMSIKLSVMIFKYVNKNINEFINATFKFDGCTQPFWKQNSFKQITTKNMEASWNVIYHVKYVGCWYIKYNLTILIICCNSVSVLSLFTSHIRFSFFIILWQAILIMLFILFFHGTTVLYTFSVEHFHMRYRYNLEKSVSSF